jgi:hypothetical protein
MSIRFPKGTRQAFTLIELLLVTILVVSLAGALVFSFTNLLRGAQMEEGAGRIESLVRYARAQAANTGRKVQLVFDNDKLSQSDAPIADVRVTWEPDPLGRPGHFEDLTEGCLQAQGIRELVQVADVQVGDHCKSRDSQLVRAPDAEAENELTAEAEPMPPITFYPDGTSDSAEIFLTSVAPEEEQRMSLRIAGITGSISRHQAVIEPTSADFQREPAGFAPGGAGTK